MFLYVLELSNEKFYVGISKNPEQRLQAHLMGEGSEWTRLHPPIRLSSQRPIDPSDESKQSLEENNETMKLMKQYGIDYVRGGMWTKITLSSSDLEMVRRMMGSTENLCYNCLNKGHYASECPTNNSEQQQQQQPGIKRRNIYNNPYLTKKRKTTTTMTTNNQENNDNNDNTCYRCGRRGHFVGDCFASIDSNGCIIIDDDDKDEYLFEKAAGPPNAPMTTDNQRSKDNNGNVCYRCGRRGHFVGDCFASIDSNGCFIIDDVEKDEYLFEKAAGPSNATMTTNNQRNNDNSGYACYRCGRRGHFVGDCFASRDSNGCIIIDDDKKEQKLFEKAATPPNSSMTCYRCGREGHFASNCYASKHSNGSKLHDRDNYDKKEQKLFEKAAGPPNSSMTCYRCGREGHFASNCYASKHSGGYKIHDRDDYHLFDKRNHFRCDYEYDVHCFRCGRRGHISTDCYARSAAY